MSLCEFCDEDIYKAKWYSLPAMTKTKWFSLKVTVVLPEYRKCPKCGYKEYKFTDIATMEKQDAIEYIKQVNEALNTTYKGTK